MSPAGGLGEPGDVAPAGIDTPIRLAQVTTPRQRHLAELGLLAVMLCWALNFITVKGTGEQIPPMTFAWVRFTTAAVILLALLRWREGRVGLSRAEILPVAVLGVIGFGIYQMLWASAIQLISAGDSALLIATTPVLAALIAVAFGHDTLTRGKLAGALIAFAGVALVVGPELSADDGSALLGYAVTLVAAICWAAYVAFSPPILRHSSPLRMATWVLAAGSLTLMPAGILASTTADWSRVTPLAWAGLVYSAVLAAGLSNIVMFEGIRVLGPARASVFQFLVPFFAVVIGAVALGDPIRVGQLVGGVVIVSGVLLTRSRWRSWRTAAGGVRP